MKRLLFILLVLPQLAFAQDSTLNSLNPWKVTDSVVSPRNASNSVRIPSLADPSLPCVKTSATGTLVIGACSSASNATTTITAQSGTATGPAIIFATSGPMLAITASGQTVTFTISSSSLNLADFLVKANNLSDLTSTSTARTNIGFSAGSGLSLSSLGVFTNTGVLTLTGTAGQVNVSNSTGTVTLSLPQNINTTSSPTFTGLSFTNATGTGNLQVATAQFTGAVGASSTLNVQGVLDSRSGLLFVNATGSTLSLTNGTGLLRALTVSSTAMTFTNASGSTLSLLNGTGVLQALTVSSTAITFTNATGSTLSLLNGSATLRATSVSSTNVTFTNATGSGNVQAGSLTLTTPLDISSYTNLSGGRSLTMNGDAVDADAELYTDTNGVVIQQPTSTAGLNFIAWPAPQSLTLVSVFGQTNNATVTVAVERRAGLNTAGTMLATSTTFGLTTTTAATLSTTTIPANNFLYFTVSSTAGVVDNGSTTLHVWFKFTYDD